MRITCYLSAIVIAQFVSAGATQAQSESPAAQGKPLTLQECIDVALKRNTDVRLAEEGLIRNQADVKSALARRLPSVNTNLLGASRSRTGPSVRIQDNPAGIDSASGERIFVTEETRIPAVDRNNFSLSASVSHTIFDAGEGRHAHNAARATLDGAWLAFDASRAQVMFSVKEAFFSLLKSGELGQVQKESLALSQRRLEEAQARLEVGSGTRVDVLRLQVDAANAQANLVNAQQQERLAVAQLNYLLGRDVLTPLHVTPLDQDELDVDLQTELTALVAQAQRANPELERLRASVRAAELYLRSSRSAYMPRISGNLSYSRSNEVLDRVYGDFSEGYRLNAGMSVSYNVFDGGIRNANVSRSQSSLQTARLNLEQRERQIALTVETTWLELQRLERILEIARRTAELATEDLTLAEERYRVGKGTLLEVLDAQVTFTQARSNLVSSRYDLAVAQADLERLLGAGVEVSGQ